VLPEIAELKSLSSYRSTITSKGADDKGAEHTSVITTEWLKESPAQHTAMKDGDKVSSETITIGDKRWMWMPTLGWREMPPQPEKPSDLPADLEGQIKKMQSDMSQAKPTFTLLGTETIDGINCRHYKFYIQFSLAARQAAMAAISALSR